MYQDGSYRDRRSWWLCWMRWPGEYGWSQHGQMVQTDHFWVRQSWMSSRHFWLQWCLAMRNADTQERLRDELQSRRGQRARTTRQTVPSRFGTNRICIVHSRDEDDAPPILSRRKQTQAPRGCRLPILSDVDRLHHRALEDQALMKATGFDPERLMDEAWARMQAEPERADNEDTNKSADKSGGDGADTTAAGP